MLLTIAFVLFAFLTIALSVIVVKKRIFIRLNAIAILLMLGFFLGGLFSLYAAHQAFSRYEQQKSWPIVKGLITETKVAGERAKRPEISYTYHFKGETVQGFSDMAMPSFGGKNYRAQSSRSVIKQLMIGDSIAIYVNPQNPKESLLKIHPKWSAYIQYLIGIVGMAVGVAFLFSGILERK